MRNGYQDPDVEEPDGDKQGKKALGDRLAIEAFEKHFGIRLNITAIKVEKNAVSIDGQQRTKSTIGSADWMQLFVGGTLFKNTSIFIENEFKHDSFHYSWFKLGFHNIGGSSLGNVIVGNLSPVDYTSFSNRLRVLAPIKADVFGIKTSDGGGKADDRLNASGSRPGVQYYGYQGGLVVSAGLSPGSSSGDPNRRLHGWGGVMMQVPESAEALMDLEGSSISMHFYRGIDADNTTNPDREVTNSYDRFILAGNIRYKEKLDVLAAYVQTEEKNWNLDPLDPNKVIHRGGSLTVAYLANEKHYPVVQYDIIESRDARSLEKKWLTLSYSYLPRENFRIGFYYRKDLEIKGQSEKGDLALINIRTMF